MTPLEDFMAERTRKMNDGAREQDQYGAFCRLMLKMDTIAVTDWMHDERKRGTSSQDIHIALGNYMANLIAPLAITAPYTAPFLFAVALDVFKDMVTGEGEVSVLAVHPDDGRQLNLTAEGIAKHGVPR
jgi:hypothetical protein